MKVKNLENILSISLNKLNSIETPIRKGKSRLKHCKKCNVYYVLNHTCKYEN